MLFPYWRENSKGSASLRAVYIIGACVVGACIMSLVVAWYYTRMGDIPYSFARLEFISIYATPTDTGFTVNLQLKNVGTKDATVGMVFLNGIPYSDYTPTVDVDFLDQTIKVGQNMNGTITLPKGGTWTSRLSVTVDIRTVQGWEFPKNIVLP